MGEWVGVYVWVGGFVCGCVIVCMWVGMWVGGCVCGCVLINANKPDTRQTIDRHTLGRS